MWTRTTRSARRPRRIAPGFGALLPALALVGVLTITGTGADAATTGIAGIAFEDLDHDGVHDAGEPAFSGHSIYLLTGDGQRWLAGATTGLDGRYAFEGLAAGSYRVQYDSTTWNPLRNDWYPTTAPIASPPRVDVQLDVTATVDWGLRRIVRSTDANAPISEHVGPSGVRVQSYVDVVPAAFIHDVLATGLLGAEATHTTVRFGLTSNSTTSTSAGLSNGQYVSFAAISYTSYLSWAAGGGSWTILAHEYGHAWSHYHAKMTQQTGNFDLYVEARGLTGDSRLGSSYAWSVEEMIAEDFRQLLGPLAARAAPQINRDIPRAADVPGLRAFLEDEFTTASGPASAATDVTAPTAAIVTPDGGSTVSGTVGVTAAAVDDHVASEVLAVTLVVDGSLRLGATYDSADGRFHTSLDTTTLTSGDHALVVEATDTAGNTGASTPVTVTIQRAKKAGGGGKSGRR